MRLIVKYDGVLIVILVFIYRFSGI